MKKSISIAFLLIYLFSATELSQLVKLPTLVEHFSEHKQQNETMSFWDFLCIHYAGKFSKDNDYEKDMKLPFKSHDTSQTFIFVANPPVTPYISSLSINFKEKTFCHYDEQFLPTFYLSGIWQPPKFC